VTKRGVGLFAVMCVVWGIPYLLIRIAVRDLSPPTLVFFRTAPAALLLLPLAVRQRSLRAALARWRWVVVYTAVELGVPWLLLSRAEQHLASSTSGLLVAGTPLVAAGVYPIVTRSDRLDWRRLLGLVVGFCGVGAVVGFDLRGADLVSVAEVGITVVGYATGPLIISRKLSELPGLGVITVSLALGALGYAPVALTHLPRHLSAEVVLSVAVLAVVCTAVAFVLFFGLIKEIGPSRSLVITYFNPLVAVLLGCTVLGEPFGAGIAVGLPLILFGSVLATGRPPAPTPGAASEPLLPGPTDGDHPGPERLVDRDHGLVVPGVPGDDGPGLR
jgi:drug/metabolite transporter (DMT)-like permease